MHDPERSAPTREQILRPLHRSNEVARRAVARGHSSFGAVLAGPQDAFRATR